MKLEIKMRDGRYIAKISSYGIASSIVKIYEVKSFKFLFFTFKPKELIAERIVQMTTLELFSRGVKDMTDEINYSISKYESARQGWEKLGVKL